MPSSTPCELRLLYVSRANAPYDINSLLRFCSSFAVNNASLSVTGLLMVSAGHFLQVLEGREGVVRHLMSRITMDGRHSRLRVVLEQTQVPLMFADWSMTLLSLDAPSGQAHTQGQMRLHAATLISGQDDSSYAVRESLRLGQLLLQRGRSAA